MFSAAPLSSALPNGVQGMTSAFESLGTQEPVGAAALGDWDSKDQLARLAAALGGSGKDSAAGESGVGKHNHGGQALASGPVARAPVFIWSKENS